MGQQWSEIPLPLSIIELRSHRVVLRPCHGHVSIHQGVGCKIVEALGARLTGEGDDGDAGRSWS
jgi:hypothetical protein